MWINIDDDDNDNDDDDDDDDEHNGDKCILSCYSK